ncbi:glycoside hydrolase family 26 protein [Streptomyces sp. 6N223]|uniref:glycoside hydrolase family 26 protein n=1 Tax=Streptomyces sp. 6N223 TaxID=3457412 RepID=UPI003FD6ABD2
MNDHAQKRRSTRRRRSLSLVAAALAAVAVSPLTISGSTANGASTDAAGAREECTQNEILVPNCGVLWGIYTKPEGGDLPATVTGIEEDIQRKFDFIHRYHDFSGQGSQGVFPDAAEKELAQNGERTLLINWTTRVHGTDGEESTRVPWADVANGDYDESVIRPAARRIAEFGQPVFLAFDHEAEGARAPEQGDGPEYVAAWRHIYEIFQEEGADNAIWTWIQVGWIGHQDTVASFYPGDEYVDWIGYDPFNYYVCRNNEWRSPDVAFSRWYVWLQRNGFADKPVMLAEYGTVADPEDESAQAQWYRDLVPALERYPNIKAVAQFNTYKNCDTRVTTQPDVLEAWAEAGRSDYINIDR